MRCIAIVIAGLMSIASIAVVGCSNSGEHREMYAVRSPDGAYLARLEMNDSGGVLGLTFYRLFVSRADGRDGVVAFEGDNGWAEAPIWQNASTLLVPFCFGAIDSVKSVLALEGAEWVKFRTRRSPNVRVHVITAPETSVAGRKFCSDRDE